MSEPFRDKFWVVDRLRKKLRGRDLKYFNWLLCVWNTGRDGEYPSTEETKDEDGPCQCKKEKEND